MPFAGGVTVSSWVTGGPGATRPPTTRAYGWGPWGTLKARTVTVHVPAAGDCTYTFSTLFVLSARSPATDQPPAKALPR